MKEIEDEIEKLKGKISELIAKINLVRDDNSKKKLKERINILEAQIKTLQNLKKKS